MHTCMHTHTQHTHNVEVVVGKVALVEVLPQLRGLLRPLPVSTIPPMLHNHAIHNQHYMILAIDSVINLKNTYIIHMHEHTHMRIYIQIRKIILFLYC